MPTRSGRRKLLLLAGVRLNCDTIPIGRLGSERPIVVAQPFYADYSSI